MGKIDLVTCIEQLNLLTSDIHSIDTTLARVRASGSNELYPGNSAYSTYSRSSDALEQFRLELLEHVNYYRKQIADYRNHLLPEPQFESASLLKFELTPNSADSNKDLLTTHDLTRPNRI